MSGHAGRRGGKDCKIIKVLSEEENTRKECNATLLSLFILKFAAVTPDSLPQHHLYLPKFVKIMDAAVSSHTTARILCFPSGADTVVHHAARHDKKPDVARASP